MTTPSILVIEDNDHNRYLVRYILEGQGYEVVEALNGVEALAAVERTVPSLILLDIQLPEMDGYEVAHRLRAESRLDPVPIIAITAFAMVGDRERILEAGCDGYIEKPIDPDAFREEIARHLGRARSC